MSRRPAFFGWVVTFGIALVLCYGVTAVERWCHGREGKAFLALAALHLHRILQVLIWLLDGPALPVMVLLSLADPLPAATGCLFAAAEWLIRLPARIFLALSPALAVSAPLWLAGRYRRRHGFRAASGRSRMC